MSKCPECSCEIDDEPTVPKYNCTQCIRHRIFDSVCKDCVAKSTPRNPYPNFEQKED